jgi:glycerol-3-phosphate acyltransferase PlsX
MGLRIALDAMGGDHGPSVIVDGALAAARHLDITLLLVGRAAILEDVVSRQADRGALRLHIVDAPDIVEMHESQAVVRRRPGASIRVAADLVARGEANALVSLGHTGATVFAAHTAFGMIAGVDRPALATAIPTRSGAAVLLDAGATVECKPAHLLQFAVMGSVYAKTALGIQAPRIGLLSVGEEETKGNELTREAHRLLKGSALDFIGNIEGREIYSGKADVIVCDGFTGNVVLKTSEGLVDVVETLLGEELQGTFSSQVGYLLSRRAFRRFSRRVDYSEYGGAPLLGVSGVTIVGHGRSSAKAVRNAVAAAARFAATDLLQCLEREVASAAASAGTRE